jgi:hypothetical protein
MGNTGTKIYESSVDFGKIIADIKAVIGTIFGIILIGIGIAMANSKPNRIISTIGTINNNPNCVVVNYNNKTGESSFSCSIDVSYTINGQNLNKTFKTTGQPYFKNDMVTLYYDPNNISNIDMYSDDVRGIGYFLIILGLILIISSITWAYLANRFEFAAALTAGTTATSMFSNSLR